MRIRIAAGCVAAGLALASCATGPEGTDLGPDVLLPPGSMPVWNGAVVWQVQQDPTAEAALSVCPPGDLADVGAVAEAAREYVWPEGGMHGLNVVGQFASGSAAEGAAAEIEAGFRDCPGGSVITQLADGSTWTTSTRVDQAPDEARFEFMAVASEGPFVTVVGFSLTGQDANWESDPIVDALQASRALLGESS